VKIYSNKKNSQQSNQKVKMTLKRNEEEGIKSQIMDIKKFKNKFQWLQQKIQFLNHAPLYFSNLSTT